MTAIVYPTSLPVPSAWVTVARERRAQSQGDGVKSAPRARSRDRIVDVEARWIYSPGEMAVWTPWYEDTLLDGTRWFAVTAPGPGGHLVRVCRFRAKSVRRERLGGGNWAVSALLEQRGRGALPMVTDAALSPLLLQSRFVGANDDDESAYLHGSPGVVGAGVVGSGIYTVNTNNTATPFAPAYLDYDFATVVPNGTDAVTVEVIVECVAVPNVTGITALTFIPNVLEDDFHGLNFGYGNGTPVYENQGFGSEYVGSPTSGPAHYAIVLSSTGLRVYFAGIKVLEALGDSTPTANQMQLILGDQNGYSEGTTHLIFHGFRVIQEEVYTGDSFTPPTVIPPP
jgi:hypothetical protein